MGTGNMLSLVGATLSMIIYYFQPSSLPMFVFCMTSYVVERICTEIRELQPKDKE